VSILSRFDIYIYFILS